MSKPDRDVDMDRILAAAFTMRPKPAKKRAVSKERAAKNAAKKRKN